MKTMGNLGTKPLAQMTDAERQAWIAEHPSLAALAIVYGGYQVAHPDVTENFLKPVNDITVGIRDTVSTAWDATTFLWTYRYVIGGGVGLYLLLSLRR